MVLLSLLFKWQCGYKTIISLTEKDVATREEIE